MTGWLILALVLLALLLLSRLRLGARAEYTAGALRAWLIVGPFRVTLWPRKARTGPEKAAKKAKKKEKSPAPAEETGPDWRPLLELARDALPVVAEAAGRLRRKIRIDRFYLDFTAAAADPAAAALSFGWANSVIGMLWPLLVQNFNVRDGRVRTRAEFTGARPRLDLDAALTLTLGQALALGLWLLIRALPLVSRLRPASRREKQKEAV